VSVRAAPPSHDTLFGGALVLHQPARGEGYRVNVDAVLLAWFAGAPRRAKRAIDLGAGVGGVGLCLLYRDRADRILFVDRDRALLLFCKRNLEANGWRERGDVARVDLSNRVGSWAAADLVVCNPPYSQVGAGRAPKLASAARVGDVEVFTRAARQVLGARGRACFVYPANGLALLFDALRSSGLEPKRLRPVHATTDRPARVALVEAAAAKPGGLVVEPPLVERAARGTSPALDAILAG
jgi:tRNA1Val (adenine37-N6)-methyltransferase